MLRQCRQERLQDASTTHVARCHTQPAKIAGLEPDSSRPTPCGKFFSEQGLNVELSSAPARRLVSQRRWPAALVRTLSMPLRAACLSSTTRLLRSPGWDQRLVSRAGRPSPTLITHRCNTELPAVVRQRHGRHVGRFCHHRSLVLRTRCCPIDWWRQFPVSPWMP